MVPSRPVSARRLLLLVSCVVALLLGALGGCSEVSDLPTATARPPAEGELPSAADFRAQLNKSRGFRDCFSVIRDPEFVTADAAEGFAGAELVMGLDLGRVQVAYPVLLLNHHEIVEHTIEGIDLLACW